MPIKSRAEDDPLKRLLLNAAKKANIASDKKLLRLLAKSPLSQSQEDQRNSVPDSEKKERGKRKRTRAGRAKAARPTRSKIKTRTKGEKR